MSRCTKTRGKISQLNRERDGRKNSQMAADGYFFFFWLPKVFLKKKAFKRLKEFAQF